MTTYQKMEMHMMQSDIIALYIFAGDDLVTTIMPHPSNETKFELTSIPSLELEVVPFSDYASTTCWEEYCSREIAGAFEEEWEIVAVDYGTGNRLAVTGISTFSEGDEEYEAYKRWLDEKDEG